MRIKKNNELLDAHQLNPQIYKRIHRSINQGAILECAKLSYQEINEKFHIQDDFDDFIDSIYEVTFAILNDCIKKKKSSPLLFTGYYYNANVGLCMKSKVKNISKSNTIHRWNIYIQIVDESDETIKAWTDYDPDMIFISINKNYFIANPKENTKEYVYSILGHEFVHVRSLYTSNGFIEPKNLEAFESMSKRILYLVRKDEANARANELVKKLKVTSEKEIEEIISGYKNDLDAARKVTDHFENILFLKELKNYIKILKSNFERGSKEHESIHKGKLLVVRMFGMEAARTRVFSSGIFFDPREPYPARYYDLDNLIEDCKKIVNAYGLKVQRIDIQATEAVILHLRERHLI